MEPETKRKRRSRFFSGLLIGLVLGWLGASLAPRSWQAYIPDAIRPGGLVDGEVVEKSTEDNRLLLKLLTDQGLVLATFTERTEEIDLLVEKGDTVTIRVQRYQPFLEDPPIERVRRPTTTETPPPPKEMPEAEPAPGGKMEEEASTTSAPESEVPP
jgi:hypothetical protein